jgi:protein involved in polysaccharide export with SLBB domain
MTFSQRSVRRFLGLAGLAAATWFLAGCASGPPPITAPPNRSVDQILLQNGDGIEVDLTGTPMTIPPTITKLNGAGTISLPSITNIVAIGKTPHQLEQEIHDAYVPKIYSHISVTVTPGDRFYTVSGQVNPTGPAKQPYTGHVTVLGAIGAAGGFNDFAARKRVQLTGQDGKIYIIDCKKALKDPKLDIEVLPGDKIFVDQKTPWEAATGQ